MANLVTDPGFELGIGWEYREGAERTTDDANEGSYSLKLYTTKGGPDGTIESEARSDFLKVSVGTTYRWVNYQKNDDAFPIGLEMWRWEPSRGWFQQDVITWDQFGSGWRRVAFVTFTPAETPTRLAYLTLESAVSVYASNWYIDDIEVDAEDDVVVKLSERAVDAIVSTMQTNFGTELAAIDTARADGVTLAVPATTDYYKRPKPEIAGATTHVEVFEGDSLNLGGLADDPEAAWADMDQERATYKLEATVRVTCFNRDGDDADTMRKRMRRYSAGLYNVFIRNTRLGATDDAIQAARIERIDWDETESDDGGVAKVQVTAHALIACEETYA